jgi:pyridoxal phosphate enzyme (YggS family)
MTAYVQEKGSMTTSERLARVTERMEQAARRAGRNLAEITLVAATKDVELKKIKEAVAAGVRVFGENYVKEAAEKIEKTKRHNLKWHFIGHLQKNKARHAVELFGMIQTVDSIELAKELSRRAKKPIDVLIEVNLAREKTKAGVETKKVGKLAREIAALENLKLKGLMAIPPYYEDPEMSRPFFVTLRRLAERINRENIAGVSMHELSMGMSHDFEVAIEEGATMVRIGTAIFGERKAAKKKGAKKGK